MHSESKADDRAHCETQFQARLATNLSNDECVCICGSLTWEADPNESSAFCTSCLRPQAGNVEHLLTENRKYKGQSLRGIMSEWRVEIKYQLLHKLKQSSQQCARIQDASCKQGGNNVHEQCRQSAMTLQLVPANVKFDVGRTAVLLCLAVLLVDIRGTYVMYRYR